MPRRRAVAIRLLCVGATLRAALGAGCSDGDTGCIERDCSIWCSRWTCNKEGCHGCGPHQGCPDKPPPPPRPPPLPLMPPWDAELAGPDTLHVYAHGSRLYANGRRLHIKGVNWYVAW